MTVSCHTGTTGVAGTTGRLSGNINVAMRVNDQPFGERDDVPVSAALGILGTSTRTSQGAGEVLGVR